MKLKNNWIPETTSLLKSLLRAGFVIVSSDNGEDRETFITVPLTAKHLTTTDESYLTVSYENKKLSLFLVYGNSPGELVCDYTSHPALDAVVTKHGEKWEGRKQPTVSA